MADAIMEEHPLNEMTPTQPVWKKWRDQCLRAESRVLHLEQALSQETTSNEVLGRKCASLRDDYQKAQTRLAQLSELADAWQQRADKLGQLNDCLSDEVLELKAKLYDYLMADLAERNEEEVNHG